MCAWYFIYSDESEKKHQNTLVLVCCFLMKFVITLVLYATILCLSELCDINDILCKRLKRTFRQVKTNMYMVTINNGRILIAKYISEPLKLTKDYKFLGP